MKGKRWISVVVVAIALLSALLPSSLAFAGTTGTVTVTGKASFVAITESESWTINGLTGSGFMLPNTTYYANPLGDTVQPPATVNDTSCAFTVTNASATVPMTLSVNMSNFAGGDAMLNTNAGTANTTAYGAYAWCSGSSYASKVVVNASAPTGVMKTSWSSATLKWGLTVSTMTNAWTSGTTQTATVTITATAS